MVERGWTCHVLGEGLDMTLRQTAVQTQYQSDDGIDDQWLKPFVIGDYAGGDDGDSIILYNFRGIERLKSPLCSIHQRR